MKSRLMKSWLDGGQQGGVWLGQDLDMIETSGAYAVLILFGKNNEFIFPVQSSCLCII